MRQKIKDAGLKERSKNSCIQILLFGKAFAHSSAMPNDLKTCLLLSARKINLPNSKFLHLHSNSEHMKASETYLRCLNKSNSGKHRKMRKRKICISFAGDREGIFCAFLHLE